MAKLYKMPAVGTKLAAKEFDGVNPGALDQGTVLKFQEDEARGHAWDNTQRDIEQFNNRLDTWLEYTYRAGRAPGPTGKVGDPKAQPAFGPPLAYWAVLKQGDAGVWWDVVQVELADGGKLACKMPRWDKITAPQHVGKK